MFSGVVAFLGGIGVGLWQSILWLRDGFWTHWAVDILIPPVAVQWHGAQKVIDWMRAQPLGLALMIFGVLTTFLTIFVIDVVEKSRRNL